ncbi:MAG: Uma2 family endonuclease [Candidatus Dechloromonas phosphoritropha]|jgi:Uma2 family endonuclease
MLCLHSGDNPIAQSQIQPHLDLEADLAWEETQIERHEYLAGEVFVMSSGTDAHYAILGNFFAGLKASLSGTPCRPFVSGMKVHIETADAVLYPDVFVTCGARDKTSEAALAKAHPTLIAEVLSDSTAAYDRGRKFELYQQIAELQEYLIIEQDRSHADLFRKNDEGLWVLHPIPPGGTINLQSLKLSLPLAELYVDVELKASAS